jgi:UPF0755 protein
MTMLRQPRALLTLLSLLAATGCGSSKETVRVIVPRGATLRSAADSLGRAGLVKWPTGFLLMAKVMGNDRSIKAGTYLLNRGTSWPNLIRALNGGTGIVSNVTIPEGFTIAQITPLLAKALDVPVESVSVAVRDSALRAQVKTPTPTLEGYLFPDTYAFPTGTSARTAVTELVRRFERAWKPEWNSTIAALGRSRHEIVTMASIVEREAKVPAERPVIAAVYYNRLRIGMPLQADPTIHYAHGRQLPRVMYRDLEIESPYNTYKHPGLPPGPIASPGAASLQAAVAPASVSYLYFVAAPDGHHEFRNTLAEHEIAKRSSRSAQDSITRGRRDSLRPQDSGRRTTGRGRA